MGNKAWQGYDEEDRKQSQMEHGEHIVPKMRQYRRRDNGFYGKHDIKKISRRVKCMG